MTRSSKQFLLLIELQEKPVTGAETMGFNNSHETDLNGIIV